MEGASTTHKEEDDGQAPRLLDAPVKIQDQEANDREGLDFMWGTDKVRASGNRGRRAGQHQISLHTVVAEERPEYSRYGPVRKELKIRRVGRVAPGRRGSAAASNSPLT